MDAYNDHLYGGPTVEATRQCRRCKGDRKTDSPVASCRNCGADPNRRTLSRNNARTRNIGGKRGRNSGTTNKSKSK